MIGQACVTARHVPQNTSCRHRPTLVHGYKKVSNRPAYTPQHKSTWNYSYTNTLTPIWTLPAACTKATNHILYWIQTAEMMVPKKPSPPQKKVQKHRIAMFGQAMFGQGGGGDNHSNRH